MNQKEMNEYLGGKILALERIQAILMGILIAQDEKQSLKGDVRGYLRSMMNDMQLPDEDFQSSSSPLEVIHGFNSVFFEIDSKLSDVPSYFSPSDLPKPGDI